MTRTQTTFSRRVFKSAQVIDLTAEQDQEHQVFFHLDQEVIDLTDSDSEEEEEEGSDGEDSEEEDSEEEDSEEEQLLDGVDPDMVKIISAMFDREIELERNRRVTLYLPHPVDPVDPVDLAK